MRVALRLTAITLVLAGGLALAGCGKKAPPPPQTPPVTGAHPLVRQMVDWDDYVGQFEAVQTVEVRPRVTGRLMAVHFSDGQLVRKGQTLFSIDARPFQAALDQARAQVARAQATLANAQSELERQKTLLAIQAVSREEYEARQATVRTAQADLQAAQAAQRAQALSVSFTRVEAPESGRVSYHRVDAGNAVTADTTVLTTIVSVDPIHFVFQGSEAVYLKYQRENRGRGLGAPVRIRLEDEPDYRWTGRLDFMDNAIDQGTGAIRGRALVSNRGGLLTPGMFGHMQMQGSHAYQGYLIPDTAIATQGAKRIVYVAGPGGVVASRVIELGPTSGGLRVIRSGLSAQDVVIVDGIQRAQPGKTVKVTMTRLTLPVGGDQDLPTVKTPPAGAATPVGVG